jgi:integrase
VTTITHKTFDAYLDAVSRDIVEGLIRKFPTGPIFRNSQGRPWTEDALRGRFRRLKKKLGMPESCAYSLRHSYAHWALTNGADSHIIVAKLLGHVDGRMFDTRYGHVDKNAQFMIDSVNRKRNYFRLMLTF